MYFKIESFGASCENFLLVLYEFMFKQVFATEAMEGEGSLESIVKRELL